MPSECGVCGSHLKIGGPIWTGKIHDYNFVRALHNNVDTTNAGQSLNTRHRIKGVLGGILDEADLGDNPLSFEVAKICKEISTVQPSKV